MLTKHVTLEEALLLLDLETLEAKGSRGKGFDTPCKP